MEKKTVRSVDRALDLLLCFTNETKLSLTQLSKHTNLPKSTVFRLLASLENKGFVMREEDTEKYRLGFRLWELSSHLERGDDPAVILLPEMERLRDQVEETVTLYVRDGIERVRIQAVESQQTIRRVAPIGTRLPLVIGASGKVLVAHADPEAQEMILQHSAWPGYVNREQFMLQLLSVQQRGYATSVEEREAGTAAIAAPIFKRSGVLAAALAVSGPTGRLTLERMEEIAPHVVRFATRMGKMLS